MVKSVDQVEKNVAASFGYVKKDLLMLNDVISSMQEKIQHLSMNHANLLQKLEELQLREKKVEKKVTKKKTAKKKTVKKATSKKTTKKVSTKPKKIVKETITYS